MLSSGDGQLLVRQLDDAVIARLKARPRERKASVEASAREAISKAAEPSVEEKLAIHGRSYLALAEATGDRSIVADQKVLREIAAFGSTFPVEPWA